MQLFGGAGSGLRSMVTPFMVVSAVAIAHLTWSYLSTPSKRKRKKKPRSTDSHNLLNLLYNIAEDQARKEGYVHRVITCDSCGVSPIRGIRYKCANCVDYDLCEACEPFDNHNLSHVFLKIRIPIPPLANPRTALLPVFYPGADKGGSSAAVKGVVPLHVSHKLQGETHFEQVEIDALFSQFRALATVTDKGTGIDLGTFEQCLGPLGLQSNLVTQRIFKFFDQNDDNMIDFEELVRGLSILCKGTQEEKMKFAFMGYDLDGSGYITRDELRQMFRAYFHLSIELVRDVVKAKEEEIMANFDETDCKPVSAVFNVPIPSDMGPNDQDSEADQQGSAGKMWPVMESMSQDAIEQMVNNAFENADKDKDGRIDYEEFKKWSLSDPTMCDYLESLGSIF